MNKLLKKTIVLCIANASVLLLPARGYSQQLISKTTRDPLSGRVNQIAIAPGQIDSIDQQTAAKILQDYSPQLGNQHGDTKFNLIHEEKDAIGFVGTFQQTSHDGVPVLGAQTKVSITESKGATILGTTQDIPESFNTTPAITADAAIDTLRALHIQITGDVLDNQLYIVDEGTLPDALKFSRLTLAWRIRVLENNSGSDLTPTWLAFVDATTSEVLSLIKEGDEDISRTVSDCSIGDGLCYLKSFNTTLNYRFGRTEGETPSGPNPISGDRLDWGKFRTQNTFGSLDTDSIYTSLGIVASYYLNHHVRNGANNFGGTGDGINIPLTNTRAYSFVNWASGLDWTTAFCPNAMAFGSGSLVFCDGNSSLGTVGHEYTHIVTRNSIFDALGKPIGLAFDGEPGSLNEGLSDIFAEAVKKSTSGVSDWTERFSILTLNWNRNLKDPPSSLALNGTISPHPDRMGSPDFYCGTTWDHGGRHQNSTVLSKSAFLTAEGGIFNNCKITGLGSEKEEMIYYRALTKYFTYNTGYNQAYLALKAACADLYTPEDCANLNDALVAVEMDQPSRCSGIVSHSPACRTIVVPDSCPYDFYKTSPGVCGCGKSEIDSDQDGTPDCVDTCPVDPAKSNPGACGCGVADTDSNLNGIADCGDVAVTSLNPPKAKIKVLGKGQLSFTIVNVNGVGIIVNLKISTGARHSKSSSYRFDTPTGIIKKLPRNAVVKFSYMYVLDGIPNKYSSLSRVSKVIIK